MLRPKQVWIKAALLESRPEEILTKELPALDYQENLALARKRNLQIDQGDLQRGIEQRSTRVETVRNTLESGRVPSMKTELEAQLAGAEAELKAYRKTCEPKLADLQQQVKLVSAELDDLYAQKNRLRAELQLYVRVV